MAFTGQRAVSHEQLSTLQEQQARGSPPVTSELLLIFQGQLWEAPRATESEQWSCGAREGVIMG